MHLKESLKCREVKKSWCSNFLKKGSGKQQSSMAVHYFRHGFDSNWREIDGLSSSSNTLRDDSNAITIPSYVVQ